MSRPRPDFSLERLAEMRRTLEASIEHAFTKVREVENSTAELQEKKARDAEELTEEDVEMMRARILAHQRTPEWQSVIDRISAGELTWRQVVVSHYAGKMEPGVKRAFDSLDRVPRLTLEQVDAINASVQNQFARPQVAAPESEEESNQAQEPAPERQQFDGDDDYFENFSVYDDE